MKVETNSVKEYQMLSQEQLKRLMRIIRNNFSLESDCEITMEANPEGIDAGKAQCIKDIGINRISLGIQSLDDRYLKFLKPALRKAS